MKNIIALILIATSVVLFRVYIDPTYQEVKGLRVQAGEFDEALRNSAQVEDMKKQLLQKYSSFSDDDQDRLRKLLPDNVDNVRVIIEIDKIASRHNLNLKDVKVSETRQSSGKSGSANIATAANVADAKAYGVGPVSFSIQGTYPDFLAFLTDLERGLRIMDISEVQVKPTDDPFGYTYSIKLQTYWLKPIPMSAGL